MLAVPTSSAATALGRVRGLWGALWGSQAWLVSIRIAAGAAAPFAGGATPVPCTAALPPPPQVTEGPRPRVRLPEEAREGETLELHSSSAHSWQRFP